MRKYFIILFAALLAVACVEPLHPTLGPVENKPAEGSKMMLEFSLPVSPVTKGEMTPTPDITTASSVHVFVYNAASGALLQVSKATLKGSVTQNTPWGTAESAITNHADFEVYVDMGSAHRYLQVVVDAPTYSIEESTNDNETGIGYADNPIFIGDSEADVASKLYTTGGATAYWQRIDLPNGLQAYTYPGGTPTKGNDWTYTGPHTPDDFYVDGKGQTVYVGDFVNASGYKITDGTGYVMSTDVANQVKFIPLVRNFVNIRVSGASGGTFTPSKAVLINVPKSGFVAPYSSASGFVSYYLKDEYLNRLQEPADPETGVKYGTEGIVSTGYTAPVPNDQYDTACPAETKCVSAVDGVISLYMYERGIATSNPTQLLVYGQFTGSSNYRWLKMDITDTDGQYIAFYRDLTYDMEIGAITGTTGYETMEEAYNKPSIGNPSASPETQTLTKVSDGQGTTIWVDYIDYASFESGDNIYKPLRYKFVGNGKTSANAVLSVTHLTGTGAITTTTLTGTPYSGTDTQDGAGGWYVVNVPLASQGQTAEKSVLRVSGTATNDLGKTVTLYRDVTFSVMPTQTMTVSMGNLSSDEKNISTTATITLPDGLGYSLFPLVIRIEPYNGSIFPTDNDVPVNNGTSTFSTLESNNSYYSSNYRTTEYFWYEKTISYDDYKEGTRVYMVNFKTVYDSGNETVVAFSDRDGHFHTEVAPLTTGPTFHFSGSNVDINASETTATFSIFSTGEENQNWTLTPPAGVTITDVTTKAATEAAAGESVTGSGSADITVTLPGTNESTTEDKEYIITATRQGFEAQTIKITQKAKVTLVKVTRTIATTSTTFNSSYVYAPTSGDDFSDEVSISFTGGYRRSTNYIDLQSSGSAITVSANTITKIVITWYSSSYAAGTGNTTITSGGGSFTYSTSGLYPTTTWTNDSGANSVSLSFARSSSTEFTVRQIEVTYLHSPE